MSVRRRRAGSACALALSLVLVVAGCGTPSPDLFVVNREGTVPGAKLTLLVSDTSARCNGGPARELTSDQTIEARVLSDDLLELQGKKEPVPKAADAKIFTFSVRTEEGTVRFPDIAQRPDVLPRLARFVRRIAIDVCRLKR